MTSHIRKSTAVICAAMVLTACTIRLNTYEAGRGNPVSLDRPSGNDVGMIVGRIDDTDSKNKITYVTIWEAKAKVRAGGKGIPIKMLEDGTFVAENVKPGSYYVPMLASDKALASITTRDVLQPFEVRAGQVHYWGAYAADFKVGSDTWGIPDRVTVSPSTRTNKRQVLQKVLLVARGSGWEQALNKEIAKK